MDLSAVRIFVRELSLTTAFYSELLGLELTHDGSPSGYCLFVSKGVRIILETVDASADAEDQALIGRATGISFEVKDIDAEYRRMSARGVPFVGVPEKQFWGGWLATFEDPSGNQLQLVQLANESPKFEAVTPRLPVADVEKALAFYVDRLGFKLGWTWGDPITHGNVCRGSISLDLISTPQGRRGTGMAYIQLSGVDAYFAELKGRNLELDPPEDRPYGMRDFEVVDLDGNRLAFGEPIAG